MDHNYGRDALVLPTGLPKSNPLRGKIVTPQMQRFRHMNDSGFRLTDLASNESLYRKFRDTEFPRFETTKDGVFFEPRKKIVGTAAQYYIKWMCANSNGEIANDHNYDFCRVPNNGYFIKIDYAPSFDGISDFNVAYVTPVDNVQIIEVHGATSFTGNTRTLRDPQTLQESVMYAVADIGLMSLPKLVDLLRNRDKFITEYLVEE